MGHGVCDKWGERIKERGGGSESQEEKGGCRRLERGGERRKRREPKRRDTGERLAETRDNVSLERLEPSRREGWR